MKYLFVVLVLVGVFFAGRWRNKRGHTPASVAAGLRQASAYWRMTAGLLSVLLMMIALVLLVREDWIPAGLLAVGGLSMAVGARRRANRDAAAGPRPTKPSGMSAGEAYAILGLEPGAGPEAVQAAYLRLMRMAHPDKGGTRGLAAQLNAARETLTGRG